MQLRQLSELKNIKNKRVLVRVGYDVAVKNGKVGETERIEKSIATIGYLIKNRARIILMCHMGRPDGKIDLKYSLKPLVPYIKKFTSKKVYFVDDCIGENVSVAVSKLKAGEILLLENLRFHAEEEKNDLNFAKKLAANADIYINEAFSNCHRVHASMVGVTKYLKAYAGLNLTDEVINLDRAIAGFKKPAVAIIGGVKISTKIKVIEHLVKKYNLVLIGGALANNFFAAKNLNIGNSVVEKDYIATAKDLLKKFPNKIILPVDVMVADRLDEKATIKVVNVAELNKCKDKKFYIIDIGPGTGLEFLDYMDAAKTIVWNGPVGFFEVTKFEAGTKFVANVLAAQAKGKSFVVVGGGDTIAAIDKFKLSNFYNFVSTAGGAMLEFLEGKVLPGIKPLIKK